MPTKTSVSKSAQGVNNRDYRKVFEAFGVVFSKTSGAEAIADECPYCGRDKFYLNITSGLYDCKKCGAQGNPTTYLTWVHQQYLDLTKFNHWLALKEKRGIASQTLKRHQLAYNAEQERWLIPFKSAQGNVVNIQFYNPASGEKRNLALPTSIYGLHQLSNDRSKILYLCEGPFDAIALDYSLSKNRKRDRYDIVATPGTFKECWAQHFEGRKVRALYDNDAGGEQHRERVRKLLGGSRVAADLRLLKWPKEYPDGFDINDMVREQPDISLPGWIEENCSKVTAARKLVVQHGRRKKEDEIPTDWIWPHHLPCRTYVSFSGRQSTFKSTIAQEIAARHTTGAKMPLCDEDGLPAGHVLYVYAEDDRDRIEDSFARAGGDFDKWHGIPATDCNGDMLNILDSLGEMEEIIREHNIRLVIIDGQNSVVGAPNISTDMLARNNVTNKLHQFAQRLNVCLIGIRNEDPKNRAMGPQSMGDMGRCVMRCEEMEPKTSPPYLKLIFVKVSAAPRSKYPDIPFSVKDDGGSSAVIVWGKSLEEDLKNRKRLRKSVPKKVSQ